MDSKILIVVAVVAVVAIAAGAGYVVMSDNDDDGTDYYFYLYFSGSSANNGWYTGVGDDAAEGFENAMDDAGFTYELSSGYPTLINGTGTYWYTAQYLYADANETAATGSISSVGTEYGSFKYSNGWISIAGYGDSEDNKLEQFASTIYYMTPYAEDFSYTGPDGVTAWQTTGPFADNISYNAKQTYDFYIYFADGNEKNGWYSAKGDDAADAFSNAMEDADLTFELSNGYPTMIGGTGTYWYLAQYLYSETDSEAATGSIASVGTEYGNFKYSNGWFSIAGYGDGDDNKLSQFISTVYYLTPYAADYSYTGPDGVTAWQTTGPFEE